MYKKLTTSIITSLIAFGALGAKGTNPQILASPKAVINYKYTPKVTDKETAKANHYRILGKKAPYKHESKLLGTSTASHDDPTPYYKPYEPYFNEGKIFTTYSSDAYYNYFVGELRTPTQGNPYSHTGDAVRYATDTARKMIEASFYFKLPTYWQLGVTDDFSLAASTSVDYNYISEWQVEGYLKKDYLYNQYQYDVFRQAEYRSNVGGSSAFSGIDATTVFKFGKETYNSYDVFNFEANDDRASIVTTAIHEGLHALGFMFIGCHNVSLCHLDTQFKTLYNDAINISQPFEAQLYDTSFADLESVLLNEPQGVYFKADGVFLDFINNTLTSGIATNGQGFQLWSEQTDGEVDGQSLSHTGRFIEPAQIMNSNALSRSAYSGSPYNIGVAAYTLCKTGWCMDDAGNITGHVIDIAFINKTADLNYDANANVSLHYSLTNNSNYQTDIKVYFDSDLASNIVSMPNECAEQSDENGKPYITCEYQNVDNTVIKSLDFVVNASEGYYPIEATARVNRHDVDIDGSNNLAFSLLRINKTKKPLLSLKEEYTTPENNTVHIAPTMELFDTPLDDVSFNWILPQFKQGVEASFDSNTGVLSITTATQTEKETYDLTLEMLFSGKKTTYKTKVSVEDSLPNFPFLNYYLSHDILDNSTYKIKLDRIAGLSYQWHVENPDPSLITITKGNTQETNGELTFVIGDMPKGANPYHFKAYFTATFGSETRTSEDISITISDDPSSVGLNVSIQDSYAVEEKGVITVIPDITAVDKAKSLVWEIVNQEQINLISVKSLNDTTGSIEVTASEVSGDINVPYQLHITDIYGNKKTLTTTFVIKDKSGNSNNGSDGGSSKKSTAKSGSSGGGSLGYILIGMFALTARRLTRKSH